MIYLSSANQFHLLGHIFDKLRGTVISLAVELRLFNDVKRRRHLGALFAEA